MTFTDQIVATFIGAFAAFLFSLALFWIKEKNYSVNQRKALIKNLFYEFEYNLNLFKKYEKKITECIEAISSDKKDVYLNLNYGFVATYFAIQFYRSGLISNFLHCEDMKRWNDLITKMSVGMEKYIMDTINLWRKSKIEKNKVFNALKHERDQVNYGIEMIEYLKGKIKT